MRVCPPEPPARTPLLPKGLDPVPANTKRIYYVKFLAHSVFADILAQRPDIRLDRLENESADEVAGPVLAARMSTRSARRGANSRGSFTSMLH